MMMPTPGELAGSVIITAAALGAATVLWKGIRAMVHRLDALDKLLTAELTPNHGGAMKDDLHGIAVSVGHLQREVGSLTRKLDTIDRRVTDHLRNEERDAS